MKKLSLVITTFLLSNTAFAESIDEAFKNGKVSGALSIYGKNIESDNEIEYKVGKPEKRAGYLNGNAAIGYETDSFYGFSAKAEFMGNVDLGEVHNGDRDTEAAPFENNALMTEAYLKYANDFLFIKAGRQALDLEWLDYYHEAVIAGITAIPDTSITLGWTKRRSESTAEMSEDFWKINENKGVYVADVKYAGFEFVELNPYFYEAPDLANWYGLKTTFNNDYFNLVAHYAQGNTDKKVDLEDESIAHIELNTELEGFTASIGYIKTDKDGGAVIMATAGDHISPFEDGNYHYDIDARTTYGGLGYTISDFTFGALYGKTKYGEEDFKEKEANIFVEYSINDSLNASFLYVNVNTNNSEDTDYDKYIAAIEYNF